jgi:hypothetical protein
MNKKFTEWNSLHFILVHREKEHSEVFVSINMYRIKSVVV